MEPYIIFKQIFKYSGSEELLYKKLQNTIQYHESPTLILNPRERIYIEKNLHQENKLSSKSTPGSCLFSRNEGSQLGRCYGSDKFSLRMLFYLSELEGKTHKVEIQFLYRE